MSHGSPWTMEVAVILSRSAAEAKDLMAIAGVRGILRSATSPSRMTRVRGLSRQSSCAEAHPGP